MNSDRELVEHFVTCLRSEKLRALSGSISADFVFSSPRVKAYNFDQFCQHLEDWSINIEVEIINVEQIDNVYIIDEILQAVDIPRNFFERAKRKVFVTVIDHLIHSVKVEFDAGPTEQAYMDAVNPIPAKFRP